MPDGLTYRNVNPDAFRVSFDGIEVGSISIRTDHIKLVDHWHWGVDTMPLMDRGGRTPSGDADTFEAALQAFKDRFTAWHATVPPDVWTENLDYMRAGATRWKKR